jgi:regulator of replication initiation timing
MSGSLKREADFKREIRRLREQRDEHRALPAKLEALRREVKRWQESSTKYAEENTRLRDEVEQAKRNLDEAAMASQGWAQRATAAEALNTPLRDALRSVVGLFEDGLVGRDTHRDGESGWSLRALRVVNVLKEAQDALDSESQPAQAPGVDGTTSDNVTFRKLAPDECPACHVRSLSVERLGGACHAPAPAATCGTTGARSTPTRRSTVSSTGRTAAPVGKSSIEWTEQTWNPVRGCTKVSPGCKHCYAETFAERWRGVKGHPYEQGFDLRLVPSKLQEPLRWRKPRWSSSTR